MRGSSTGNRVTALRWSGLLRQLGHRVKLASSWQGQAADLLIAIHAIKSAEAVLAASRQYPDMPVAMLLAGTDIYSGARLDPDAAAALEHARILIALQPHASDHVPKHLRHKVRIIVQSATHQPAQRSDRFTAAVLAHLRPIKNPLLAIQATDLVPASIDMQLILAGDQLDTDYGKTVESAIANSDRASWVGPLSRRHCKQLLASSHVSIVPSEAEGGANAVSESIAAGTPILCSSVPGNLGLLGDDWPGAFPKGDATALSHLLERAATEQAFLDDLCQRTTKLQTMVDPTTELKAWRRLLTEVARR
jgi:putative glycosyltransferase (TIGR04348 family)